MGLYGRAHNKKKKKKKKKKQQRRNGLMCFQLDSDRHHQHSVFLRVLLLSQSLLILGLTAESRAAFLHYPAPLDPPEP